NSLRIVNVPVKARRGGRAHYSAKIGRVPPPRDKRSFGGAMSVLHPVRVSRNSVLASAAALALIAAGAVGEGALTAPHLAQAAAVVTSDLPGGMPSFAPLISRVKPAVVSVKVKIVRQAGDLTSRLENLPPQIQRFFQQF